MATYCFNLAAILAVNVMHSSSRVITRDQQAKIADTQTLGKHVEWHIFIFLIFGMVWYGNTLFNDAGPDSNLLVSTGGVKTLTIYKKEKKEEIFTCEYFWCDHNYHLAIISSNNVLKLVDRFGYLCVKREAIPQFSPAIIETLFEELSIWFRKG